MNLRPIRFTIVKAAKCKDPLNGSIRKWCQLLRNSIHKPSIYKNYLIVRCYYFVGRESSPILLTEILRRHIRRVNPSLYGGPENAANHLSQHICAWAPLVRTTY